MDEADSQLLQRPSVKLIEVPQRYISCKTIEKGGVTMYKAVTPDNLRISLEADTVIFELEISRDAQKPSKNLEQGFQVARELVNNMRLKTGLSPLDLDAMQIAVLKESDFLECYRACSDLQGDSALGFAVYPLRPVVIRQASHLPEYMLASFAAHELAHRWLELVVNVYSSEERPSGETRVLLEKRRSGLVIDKIRRKGGRVVSKEESGELLNELPNYLLQKKFLDLMAEDNRLKIAFQDEIGAREGQLLDFMEGENNFYGFKINGKDRVFLHKSLAHFNKKGEPLCKDKDVIFSLLAMQLAADLEAIGGEIDGRPFLEVFLGANVDPILQNKLRVSLDSRLGNGFYKRLKKATGESDDLVSLLVEVQSKLYKVKSD